MAKYPKLHTTNKGRELVSMANVQNKAVTYTKAVLGDGSFSGNIDTLTDIVSTKMECLFNNASNIGNGQFQLDFVINNKELENGFYAREVGIFAKIDGGEEVLFAYTNGGNYVDYIPDKSTPIDAQTIEADINIGDAENVTIVKSGSTYLIFKDLNEHDNNENAHTPLLNKWINKSFSKFKEAVIGVVKDALTEILDTQIKLDANGFVRMGFLGGFTIQWGFVYNVSSKYKVNFPTAFSVSPFAVIAIDTNIENDPIVFGIHEYSNASFVIAGRRISGITNIWFRYIAIGK